MASLDEFSIKARNFKCFGASEQGFDVIKPVNLIIGRNNSGKSSLLDIINYAVNYGSGIADTLWHDGQRAEIVAESELTPNQVQKVFPSGKSTSTVPERDDWVFAQRLVGCRIKWRLVAHPSGKKFVSMSNTTTSLDKLTYGLGDKETWFERLAKTKAAPFEGKVFKRIDAERSIKPEGSTESVDVRGNGLHVTNIIRHCLAKANQPSELIEEILLGDLNNILGEDARFSGIVCQQLPSNEWEIFLKEDAKGRIALSESGSGLKMIILILVFIHLVPSYEKKDLSSYIFALEEPENNLHPALFRRLLSYIGVQAQSHGCVFFITTHSPIAIDYFSKSPDAQLVHVAHNGTESVCRTIETYGDTKAIFDDLDIRASDLLQANGIVWVEGPSDRIYLNAWIALWSNHQLSEGTHYVCVPYGGLLVHLSASDPYSVKDKVAIFRVNRNLILHMDRETTNPSAELSTPKDVILKEVQSNGGLAWVTQGKEMENYIPAMAIAGWLNISSVSQVGEFEDFFSYLDGVKAQQGGWAKNNKPEFAKRIALHMTRESMSGILDLGDKIEEICIKIREWNKI